MIRETIRIILGTLFRWLPLSVEPGLRVIGNPDEKSPVFVTANFDLTLRRVLKHIKNLDCYLLVAPTRGINVWCAAVGGDFTAHSVISVIKTSGISEIVTHSQVILPQLSAPGIDAGLVKTETGWNCKFGPVYARDIPRYIAGGCEKTSDMHHVSWSLIDRLDVGYAIFIPVFLVILVILAIFLRAWLLEFAVLSLGTLALTYGLYPLIPGKTGWCKLFFLEGLLSVALIAVVLSGIEARDYIRNLLIMEIGLVLIIGLDFTGTTPYQKSELEPWLVRLGIRRLGFMNIGNTVKMPGSIIAIDRTRCTDCGVCIDVCPVGVYRMENNEHRKVAVQYPKACEDCQACILQCPTGAISFTVK
ncbi:MAG: 4Fe-4S binding protein [Dehalococcoidales bacterium]|nr:MAG: 4Fe-4S binding protein [Dehalococcoidales bacterium]